MYFLATHEVFVQIINPWLRKETTCDPGQWKAQCLIEEHNSQTWQNLDPKTAQKVTHGTGK